MRVLIVEDDDAIATPLAKGLVREGLTVDRVETGARALERAANTPFDVVLLDLGLPDRDGFDVCRELRARSEVPIIVVTARSEEVDRVVGLELGADDYIVKPFGFRELVARIRAVARRSGARADSTGSHLPDRPGSATEVGVLVVDRRTRRVALEGADVALTPKEFDLLAFLAEDPGAVCGRQQVLEEVWDPHWYGPTKTLDVHVASLRKKLGDPRWIETVRGVGFRLREPVDRGPMKRRLLWSYLSITAFVLLVLEIPLGVSYGNSVERRLTSDVQHDAFALAIRTQEPLDTIATSEASRQRLQELATDYHANAGGRVVIVDAQGNAVADSDEHAAVAQGRDFSTRPEVAAALSGAQVSGIRSSRTLGSDLLYVALPVSSAEGVQGAVRITYPASAVGDRIREIWLLLAATGGVVLGIVFLVSLLLARSMARPLGDLRDAAVRLGRGELSVRAAVPKGPTELTELSESFNVTAARLEQLVYAQRGFVADASHQLRTPLAALRLRLEILESDVSGAVADDLEGALAEVERLSRLVDGLLALARAEQAVSDPVPVSLQEIVAGRCEAWDAFAAERHVTVEGSVSGTPYARATPGRLEQVVDNLLNNALEVAPAGTIVRLSAAARGNAVELVVSDQGPGMSDEECARAFDRFWQSGVARRQGRPDGHFGLGLAIVRELVVGDGGDISLRPVQASAPRGLEVTVRLRRADTRGGGSALQDLGVPDPRALDEVVEREPLEDLARLL